MTADGRNRILVGDVRDQLAAIESASVDCIITSPPYFQLRNYGIDAQIGLESSVGKWVDELRLVFAGLVRVLKPTGSLWLNLGDTYSRHGKFGAAAKSLLLGPERLLLALSEDGWIVRNKVIWAKTNPMPHAVRDRLSNSYDVVYFLTRGQTYFFDLDAIRLPHRSVPRVRPGRTYPPAPASAPLWRQKGGGNRGLVAQKARGAAGHPLGKNPGDVWHLASASFRGAHFATFPPALVERALRATCPELICNRCGSPFERRPGRRFQRVTWRDRRPLRSEPRVLRYRATYTVVRELGPVLPACQCQSGAHPGLVLDPFFGAGTVGLVAERHGRSWIGIEINPSYAHLAEDRISAERLGDGPPVDATADAVVSAAKPSTPERREP